MPSRTAVWPELPYEAWKDTYATLHMWTQIVGKIRLVQTPWLNHSWHVVLYVTPRGLTTSPIPYGERSFELDFDFLDHVLLVSTDDGGGETHRPVSADRRRFLRRADAIPGRARHRGPDPRDAQRGAGAGPLQRGPHARALRPGLRRTPLAPSRPGRARAVPVPHRASSANAARCISSGGASIWR